MKNIPLLGCWASKASTYGCATVYYSAVPDLAHNLAVLTRAAAACGFRVSRVSPATSKGLVGELCSTVLEASGLVVALHTTGVGSEQELF